MHTETATLNPARLASREKKPSAATLAPVMLNEGQAAAVLGVSRRKFHELRAAGIVGPAIVLGPRALRWHRDSLVAEVLERAPRVGIHAEPQQLAEARAERRVYRDGARVL